MNMITYDQVKEAMINPPTQDLVYLYNDINKYINQHNKCLLDDNPFDLLDSSGNFCVSATSIQSDYIAFVLGKHTDSTFPSEVIAKFFNIETDYQVQFGQIKGKKVDGCICLIHKMEEPYDLHEVYENIYS